MQLFKQYEPQTIWKLVTYVLIILFVFTSFIFNFCLGFIVRLICLRGEWWVYCWSKIHIKLNNWNPIYSIQIAVHIVTKISLGRVSMGTRANWSHFGHLNSDQDKSRPIVLYDFPRKIGQDLSRSLYTISYVIYINISTIPYLHSSTHS